MTSSGSRAARREEADRADTASAWGAWARAGGLQRVSVNAFTVFSLMAAVAAEAGDATVEIDTRLLRLLALHERTKLPRSLRELAEAGMVTQVIADKPGPDKYQVLQPRGGR